MIKFSVVIPSYKINKFLFKTLSSVLKQTTKPYEIIIVFSNKISKDQSNLILKKNKNLKRFFLNNGNVSQNRNYGALKAKGNYLAFLDDDDLWNKNYLRYLSKILNQERSKLIITWLNKIKDQKISKFKEIRQKVKPEDLFTFNPGIIGSNIVIEKKIFKITIKISKFLKFLISLTTIDKFFLFSNKNMKKKKIKEKFEESV